MHPSVFIVYFGDFIVHPGGPIMHPGGQAEIIVHPGGSAPGGPQILSLSLLQNDVWKLEFFACGANKLKNEVL